MFNKKDPSRNECMLRGNFRKQGYDWWWHSFTGINEKTGEEKPFFIEFFLCNPALAKDEPVFGQLPENKEKGIKPSYLMVKAGTWGEPHFQLHRFFSWKDVEVHMNAPYSVKAHDCYCDDFETRGKIEISENDAKNHPEWMCESGSMEWDLKIDKQVAFNVGYGAGKLFRVIEAYEMYWHAEGMKSSYSGTVKMNGQNYIIKPETSYGYADKNWGRNFTSPWVWLSSCDLTSNITGKKLTDSVFDIGGGCPKVYFVALKRKLLSAFWYEGKPYEFNFSKFWTHTKTQFSSEETDSQIIWHVRQETTKAVMETEVTCEKKDMLLVKYESPDGMKRHNRLWNGGNGVGTVKLYEKKKGKLVLIDDISVKHIGCEYGEYC
ncbi:MAG: tocopherol cyclase family protein [Treponemataceae bacterium]|nr:tocopherol cyclase family protein [Spirochaetales bacterium]MDY6031658.1 tocopherol cyclase family protein [Treponemataceae bacterium]